MLDTLAHLARRLVGEGDGHDLRGRHAFVFDQVGDAVDDDTGLSGAWAGDDQERPSRGLHRLPLRRVQSFERGQQSSWGRGYQGAGRDAPERDYTTGSAPLRAPGTTRPPSRGGGGLGLHSVTD